jgi:hypothetical protein
MLIDDAQGARVSYNPALIPKEAADEYFARILQDTPCTTEVIKRWNRLHTTNLPRK